MGLTMRVGKCTSIAAAVVIVLIWLGLAVLCGAWLYAALSKS